MEKMISLKELRMLIDTTKADLGTKKYEVRNNSTEVVQKSPGLEDVSLSIEYDFDNEFKTLIELEDKLVKYEVLAQEANALIKVDGMSLTEILKKLKSLRSKISVYDILIDKKPYNKRVDVSNSGTYYYEMSTLRYEVSKLIEEREAMRNEVQTLEVALDRANTEPNITIEV